VAREEFLKDKCGPRAQRFEHHWHRRICKSSLLKWKRWPSTEGGTHGPRPEKLMRIFFEMLLIYLFLQN